MKPGKVGQTLLELCEIAGNVWSVEQQVTQGGQCDLCGHLHTIKPITFEQGLPLADILAHLYPLTGDTQVER